MMRLKAVSRVSTSGRACPAGPAENRRWPLGFPIRQAAPQVARDAGGGLVTLLRRLGEQLHDKARNLRRNAFNPLIWWHRHARDMAMDPFHGIGSGKGQGADEHLIERDAERVEIAAGIDRAVHAPGLFGGHASEGPGDELRRLGHLPFARQARCDAEPCQPDLSVRAIHQNIGGFDVFVDEAVLMRLAQGGDDADRKREEEADLHGRAEQPVARLAARIFKCQHNAAALLAKRQWPHRPVRVQLILQLIFMGQAFDAGGGRMFCGGRRLPSAPRCHPR